MPRGPSKHMRRLAAPKHWMLDKLSGVWAPKPSPGPHKQRECLPLLVMLRNRLKYALNRTEVKHILMSRSVKVDGKVRTDVTYPAGFMDVITIDKSREHFRLLWTVKGKYAVHRITPEEAKYKLCRVRHVRVGARGVPFLVTHDGRTIRYPDPDVKVNDTIKVNIETGKIEDFVGFDHGNVCMATAGHNIGRVGVIISREKHPGSFEIVHVKDAAGHTFNTRAENLFVIGKGTKSWVSLPKGKGIKLNVMEDAERRLNRASN
eukprot:Rmarinus@m.4809